MLRSLVILVALGGCVEHVHLGDDGDGGPDPLAGLVSIDVAPPSTTIALTAIAAPPTRVDLVATGHFADGTARDITGALAWTTDVPAAGAFSGPGRYATSGGAAGHITLAATAPSAAIRGTAAVTITLDATITDDVFPPPGDPATLFPAGAPVATDMPKQPSVAYPDDGAKFPQDLAPITVQLVKGGGNDTFRLAFDSDVVHLVVFTGSDRWRPDAPTWRFLAASTPGRALALTVLAAASATPGTVYGGAPARSLAFSRGDAGGAITFWSNATNGVLRAPPGATAAAPLYPAAGDATCAGCHAIARDGRTLATGYGGDTLQTVDLATGAALVPATAAIPAGWSTFSPTGDRVLVAANGALALYDARTGAALATVNTGGPATHPDWSPDGAYVAVALAHMAMDMPMSSTMDGGAIARIPVSGNTFGAPETLVTSANKDDNNFFPRYSPDGQWIAYVHADSASHDAQTAELRMIAASGGTPIRLTRASHRTFGDNLAVTMPSWAPSAAPGEAWLAFASQRPYGIVRPMAKPSQIWVTAIDLMAAATRADPSSPAFWLPSQTPAALDNNPIWTVADLPIDRRR